MQSTDDRIYQDLANAIVLEAVEDYRNALNGIGFGYHSPEKIKADLEKFFRSFYFKLLTKVDGEYLIERLNKEHNEKGGKDESNIDTSNT
jgi:hypothetical protein